MYHCDENSKILNFPGGTSRTPPSEGGDPSPHSPTLPLSARLASEKHSALLVTCPPPPPPGNGGSGSALEVVKSARVSVQLYPEIKLIGTEANMYHVVCLYDLVITSCDLVVTRCDLVVTRGSTCKFRKALCALRNLHVDPLSLHTSMRNEQLEFNP